VDVRQNKKKRKVKIKKILGLFLIIFIFLSAKTMYANVDPSESLTVQYEKILQNLKNVTMDNTTKEVSSSFEEIEQLMVELKTGNHTKIDSLTEEILTNTNKNIIDYQNEYKNKLAETVADLKTTNFDDFVKKEEIEFNEKIGNSLNEMLNVGVLN
jgi:hypothetical protein